MTDITKRALAPPRALPVAGRRSRLFYRLLAALLICAALAVAERRLPHVGNILNVLRQASLMFLIASGLTLVILTAGLDLSVGANVALSACLAGDRDQSHRLAGARHARPGFALRRHWSGLLNGMMVTALRIPSFIATYGMLWMLNGLTYWYMAGETIHGFPAGFRQIGSGYLLGVPIPVYLMMVFLAIGTLSSRSARSGARRSMRSAPIRSRRGSPAFRSRARLAAGLRRSAARWPGSPSIIFLARLNSARGRHRRER